MRKDFHKYSDENLKRKNRKKRFVIFTRTLIFLFLLIAISSPFVIEERFVKGDPFVKILVDNSTSFDLFDKDSINNIINSLKKNIGVEVENIGSRDKSAIGDDLLRHIEPHESVLLLSDGNINSGTLLGDVELQASRLNTSINSVKLNVKNNDYSIEILGPSKTTPNVENFFTVKITGTNEKEYRVKVEVDGRTRIESSVKNGESFSEKFEKGYHKITATLYEDDFFSENNVFYKTVRVIEKPKVLLYSERDTPLAYILNQVYDVDFAREFPDEINLLKDYYSIVVNDVPADRLESKVNLLEDYIDDGNGLTVFGGENSYDFGDYKESKLESILPVFVAEAGKKEGDVFVVIVIDISGSTGASYGEGAAVDVEKMLALSVLDSIGEENFIGVVAFDTEGNKVWDLERLKETNREELESKIKKLTSGGGTMISSGIMEALEMLKDISGSKNMIVISDGKNQAGSSGDQATYKTSQIAADDGVKIFTIGVGEKTDEVVMKQIASIGNGFYFKAEESNKVKIVLGDLEEEKKKDLFNLVILDESHFITEDLDIDARIYGYNTVVPKKTAKLLISASTGDPVVSVWRLGLGRVASVTTDDGVNYAGELLNEKNSKLITRVINWAIGDPERKKESFVNVEDGFVNGQINVLYKGESPKTEELEMYKIDEDLYSGNLIFKDTGFKNVLGIPFAVNYRSELLNVGFNKGIESLVENTGGNIFEESDIQGMINAIRSQSQRSILKKWYYRWPFSIAALILLLIDISIRLFYNVKVAKA